MPVTQYDSRSPGAMAYKALAAEISKKEKLSPSEQVRVDG
jgi:hypothetical protein